MMVSSHATFACVQPKWETVEWQWFDRPSHPVAPLACAAIFATGSRLACAPPCPPHPSPYVQALAAAESVSGEACVRVALVLLLTAHVYSRTGRVTLAEGLYREASKMLQLRPGSTGAHAR